MLLVLPSCFITAFPPMAFHSSRPTPVLARVSLQVLGRGQPLFPSPQWMALGRHCQFFSPSAAVSQSEPFSGRPWRHPRRLPTCACSLAPTATRCWRIWNNAVSRSTVPLASSSSQSPSFSSKNGLLALFSTSRLVIRPARVCTIARNQSVANWPSSLPQREPPTPEWAHNCCVRCRNSSTRSPADSPSAIQPGGYKTQMSPLRRATSCGEPHC